MAILRLTGSKWYYNQMEIHTITQKESVSLAREFKKHLSNITYNNVVIYQGNYLKGPLDVIGLSVIIMSKIMLIYTT